MSKSYIDLLFLKEIIDAVNSYFEDLDKPHYKDGLIKSEHRYDKCTSLSGDYVEK